MIYITGDCHGRFDKIKDFCDEGQTTKRDIMIILGDAEINYYSDSRDKKRKNFLESLPISFLFLYGNHEIRPKDIATYTEHPWGGGVVYIEKKYPSLMFARDGDLFFIDGKKILICGGAYSVDKYYRLGNGILWQENEQPNREEMERMEENLLKSNNSIDYILTHTCPISFLPDDTFCSEIDQSTVDKTTENWLQEIYNKAVFKRWFCGHYHIDRDVENVAFLFENILQL